MSAATGHRLVCNDRPLGYKEKAERHWACSCGEAAYFGYDATVRRAHRVHRAEVTLAEAAR